LHFDVKEVVEAERALTEKKGKSFLRKRSLSKKKKKGAFARSMKEGKKYGK